MSSQEAEPGWSDERDHAREQAAQWLILLDATPEPEPEQQRELDAWLAADPLNRKTFDEMRQLWSTAGQSRTAKRLRRRAGLATICIGVALAASQLPWGYWAADHRTTVGEVRAFALPDGSLATLDSNSAIDVHFDGDGRRIALLRGAVLVEVPRSDGADRFIVTADEVDAEALGTRYAVRITSNLTRVSVYESDVRVHTVQRAAIDLKPGQAIDIEAATPGVPYAISGEAPSWASGRLVFNDAPLSDVVDSLARYRPGLLHLSGTAAKADRRFTGVLPTDNSDAALALLARSLDLEVRRYTDYLVWIE